MNPVFLCGLAAGAVLVILYYLRRQFELEDQDWPQVYESETFVFEPDRDSMAPHVKRRTVIRAPQQRTPLGLRGVQIETLPLPPDPTAPPPPDTGIRRFVTRAIHFQARDRLTGATLFDFDPPLEITVEFEPEDTQEVARHPDGTPRLALNTFWEAADGPRWEKLRTRVRSDPPSDRGQLVAELRTLHPNDPLEICEE